MILVADSGSTKTEWALIKNKNEILAFTTIGLNPVFVDSATIISTIKSTEIINYNQQISEVYFYGAGCASKERASIIENPLEDLFHKAKIIVDTDLLGAAISLFGEEKGIVGILGTGSNTGVCSRGEITQNIKSLGYILGDEGSGSCIGKTFIKHFLNNELPKEIHEKFDAEYNITLNQIITKVYKEQFPNRFLASFMPFIYQNKNNEFVHNLLKNSFVNFFQKTILKYPSFDKLELRLTGSISFYFQDIIKEVSNNQNVKLSTTTKSPINNLVSFYINK